MRCPHRLAYSQCKLLARHIHNNSQWTCTNCNKAGHAKSSCSDVIIVDKRSRVSGSIDIEEMPPEKLQKIQAKCGPALAQFRETLRLRKAAQASTHVA